MKAHFTHGYYASPMAEISLRTRVCQCLLFLDELAGSKVDSGAATAIPFSDEGTAYSRFISSAVSAVASMISAETVN